MSFLRNKYKLPFISVIIPTLNEEKYLENCLISLRNQDYKGMYEIIVADSRSKDNTVKIAKKYADKVITINKKTPGAGRNAGAKASKGEILLFIDADTIALPNLLTCIAKIFRKKDIVGVACPIFPIDYIDKHLFAYWIISNFSNFSTFLKTPMMLTICTACTKKAFEKVGGFDEHLKAGEDIDFSLKLGKIGKCAFTKDTFVLTSTRRLKEWGIFKTLFKYWFGYTYGKITKKPKGFEPIR